MVYFSSEFEGEVWNSGVRNGLEQLRLSPVVVNDDEVSCAPNVL